MMAVTANKAGSTPLLGAHQAPGITPPPYNLPEIVSKRLIRKNPDLYIISSGSQAHAFSNITVDKIK